MEATTRVGAVTRSPRRTLLFALTAAGLIAASCGSDPSTARQVAEESTTLAPPPTEAPATDPGTTQNTTPSTEPATTESAPDPEPTDPTNPTDPTDPTTTTSAPPTTDDPTFDAFQWSPLDDEGTVEEGFLDVPLDYDDPDGEQASIYVVRHRAGDPDERIGSLLVNPGGPGFGGSILAEQAEFIYGRDLLDRFDIIGWDPRGTGLSEPAIDCVDDYDPYFGIETGPDTPAEETALRDAAAEFGAGCAERSGAFLPFISTVDAARDMDAIREALGEDEISYFGWSYGTQLGATWATLFPDTVRAAVLDGAINPTTGRVQGLIDQAAGFDSTLDSFLAACSSDEDCAFHNDGEAAAAFEALIESLEVTPLETEEGRPPLTDGVFELAVAQALYSESSWPRLADALAAAQEGDGVALLALYDSYYGRFNDSYGNELEAYFAITCADDPPTASGDAAVEEAIAVRPYFENASRIGFTQAYELVVCASLPPFGTEPFEITGEGAGPIMVVGNTGDPATPYEGSRVMAETLEEGFFVTVEADTHTAYSISSCAAEAIEAYLLELEVPDDELVCDA